MTVITDHCLYCRCWHIPPACGYLLAETYWGLTKTASGVLHDSAQTYQGILCCLNVMQSYSTRVNVMLLMPIRKVRKVLISTEHTNAQQCYAQICCNKFHPNVILKKVQIEIHSYSEVKYGSCCANLHENKLLWKSSVLNLSRMDEKCRKYRQNLIYTLR